jgi:hypothetical protein
MIRNVEPGLKKSFIWYSANLLDQTKVYGFYDREGVYHGDFKSEGNDKNIIK